MSTPCCSGALDSVELFGQCRLNVFLSDFIFSLAGLFCGLQGAFIGLFVLTRNLFAQTIFADNTYSKPFFLTYLNTSCFILPLLVILVARVWKLWRLNRLSQITSWKSFLEQLDSTDPDSDEQAVLYQQVANEDAEDDVQASGAAGSGESAMKAYGSPRLGLRGTATLSLQFCILWVRVSIPLGVWVY